MTKPLSLAARCRAAGVNYSTAKHRRKLGWPEHDLCVAPLPPNHTYRKAHPTKQTHPWRRTPGAASAKAKLSALELRKRAKRERGHG